MSKSADNHLETPPHLMRYARWQRIHRPGRNAGESASEVCNVLPARILAPGGSTRSPSSAQAGIGCVDCKKLLTQGIVDYFAPFRERRAALQARPEYVREVVRDGAARASRVARETIHEVKAAMNLLS